MKEVVILNKKHLYPIDQIAMIERMSDKLIISFMDGATLVQSTSDFVGLEVDVDNLNDLPPLKDGLLFKKMLSERHLIDVRPDVLVNTDNITAITVSPSLDDDWRVTLAISGGVVNYRATKLFDTEFDAEEWVKAIALKYYTKLK